MSRQNLGENGSRPSPSDPARSITAERDEGASVGVAERELAEVRQQEPQGVTPATQRGPPSGE